MKPDDEEFKKRIETIVERGKKIDELRVTTIKGHLILEEALDTFIDASLFYPEQLDSVTFNFHQKGHLALSLSLGLEKDEFWSVFWAINQLRNKIAHKLDSKEIEEKVKLLRRAFLKVLSERQRSDVEKFSDNQIVNEACYVTAGFLAMLTDDARGRRRAIDEHWKSRSGA
jgi:hypothetical protein